MPATKIPAVPYPRRAAHALFGAIAATALLVHLPPASAEGFGSADAAFFPPRPLPAARGPETAIVVLGYGLLPDGGMRQELIDRLRAGYVQALLAPAAPMIVTGGNAHNGVTEARAMADWLIGHGIPATRIHLEPDADSTAQNAVHSAAVMREIGALDAVVITSADHIARAVGAFRDAGIDVVGTMTPEQVPPLARWFGLLT